MELIIGCVDATKRALMYSVADGYIYGSVNFSIACLFLLPTWILLWSINVSWIEAPVINIQSINDEANESIPTNTLDTKEREKEKSK